MSIDVGMGEYPCWTIEEIEAVKKLWCYKPRLISRSRGFQVESIPLLNQKAIGWVTVLKGRAGQGVLPNSYGSRIPPGFSWLPFRSTGE